MKDDATLTPKKYISSDVAVLPWPAVSSKCFLRPQVIDRYHYRSDCREAKEALASTVRGVGHTHARRPTWAHVPSALSSRKPSPPFSSLSPTCTTHPTGCRPSTLASVIAYTLRLVSSSASSCVRFWKIGATRHTLTLIRSCEYGWRQKV